jgi:tetrahydromethanopterin S-methyltransferase subunit B
VAESLETRVVRLEERMNASKTIVETFGPTAKQTMENAYEVEQITERLDKLDKACAEIKAAVDKSANRRTTLYALVPVFVALITTAGFLIHG